MKRNVTYVLLGLLLLLAQRSLAVVEGDPYTCVGMYAWFNASSGITGGTWSSSNTAVATINASTGQALGVSTGTTTISYSSSGGVETMVLTVTTMPPMITGGDTTMMLSETKTLSDAMTGGKWQSTVPFVASIDSVTGIVTAHAYGSTTILYGFGGCGRTFPIRVTFPAAVNNVTQAPQISAYPNPTNGTVTITWGAAAGVSTVTICDITGNKVYSTAIDMSASHGSQTLSLTDLADGLYLLNVCSSTANYSSRLEIRK